MLKPFGALAAFVLSTSLSFAQPAREAEATPSGKIAPELVVLGTLQDGGSPHAGCEKSCCAPYYQKPDPARKVVSLGVLDPSVNKAYLFEATPDLPSQLYLLRQAASFESDPAPAAVLLTHAHIGHYTGLMYLGRESMNAVKVPVYVLPRMGNFLASNGPWDQLVRFKNITLEPLADGVAVSLSPQLQVTPFRVPHRDEYSETMGFEIAGPEKKVLFIPDIDKWERWDTSLVDKLAEVDLAFLDATFFDGAEIGYRDIREIPHPFVVESLALLSSMPERVKNKVYFIHMNHTNPLLDPESAAAKEVEEAGFRIARVGDRFKL